MCSSQSLKLSVGLEQIGNLSSGLRGRYYRDSRNPSAIVAATTPSFTCSSLLVWCCVAKNAIPKVAVLIGSYNGFSLASTRAYQDQYGHDS